MRTLCLLVVAPLLLGQAVMTRLEPSGDAASLTLSARNFFETTVLNAPYSTEEVSERVQTLADGTKIKQPPSKRKLWRDSQGRTRTERPLFPARRDQTDSGFVLIEIRDPVAGFYYFVDNQNKVAHRFPLATAQPSERLPQPTTAPAKRSVIQSTDEKLGPEVIEGILAEGTRTTRTTPVGEVGNDRPLVSTTEYWFSKELRTGVVLIMSDPQTGETSIRKTNISRAAPDPSLFMPPHDYTVVDEKDSFTLTVKR